MVIGAQAVYEHTRHLADVPPTATSDGDLTVDPRLVSDRPLVADAMIAAGFHPARPERPGIYSLTPTAPGGQPVPPTVDLIAPEALAGTGTRGARMGVHGKSSVGRARGVEMALLDKQVHRFGPIGASGRAAVDVAVAGVAALVCAKSWKLHERFAAADAGKPSRFRSKDAADMWRLMAVSNTSEVRATFERCERHPDFGATCHEARRALTEMFSDGGRGCEQVVVGLASSGLSEQDLYDTMSRWITRFVGSP